jgi:hypothetical protein
LRFVASLCAFARLLFAHPRRVAWGENINDDDWFYRFSFPSEKLNESSERREKFTAYMIFILRLVFCLEKRKTCAVCR